jgi:chemotaxis protein methyltransferase CheR
VTAVVGPRRTTALTLPAWSDIEMIRIAAIVRDAAGLVFSANRIPSAEQGIRRAMHGLGLRDLAVFRRAIEEPGAARDALLAELTIGESYFFREPAQLELIARELLPLFAEQRRPHPKPLRLWSAGCSNGEEPYSLAMLLREAGWAHGSDILGSDISIPRLAAAKRGHYSEWSMRATPRPLVERYFDHIGKQYILHRDIRAMVTWRAINLAVDFERPAGPGGMDVILCRNVLIYFSMETVAQVAERLLDSLAPDGWLLVSASDPPLTDLVACETVTTAAGLAYRRGDRPGRSRARADGAAWAPLLDALPARTAAPIEPPAVTDARMFEAPTAPAAAAPAQPLGTAVPSPAILPAPAPELAALEQAYAAGAYDRVAELAAARVAAGHDNERARVLHVRALANRNRLEDAGAASAAALDQFPLSPELHLLHATLLARAGYFGAAHVAARRALYLDPGLIMAHIVGADAMSRTGDTLGAGRALRAAADALGSLPADAAVAAADGETAGRLRQIVAFHLKALAAGTADERR